MKKSLLALLLIPSLSFGAAFDMFINQRNIADSATLNRTISVPLLGGTSVFGTGPDNLPVLWKLGASMGVLGNELISQPEWYLVQNKPIFATVATSGNYNDLSNKPSTAAQVNSDWLATSGVEQVLNKPSLAAVATSGAYSDLSGMPTTLAGYGITDAYPRFGNPSNFLTGVTGSQVIAALGFTPYNSANISNFVDQAGARSAISLTTTGSSGSASYNASTGVLNIPSYTSSKTQSSATRALNTAFQISAIRDADVRYSVQCTITASISGGQQCDVILEIASDSAFTSNVQTLGIVGTGQTYTLAVALQGVAPQTAQVTGYVPAGYYARLRTVNVTGSPTYQFRAGQEVLQ